MRKRISIIRHLDRSEQGISIATDSLIQILNISDIVVDGLIDLVGGDELVVLFGFVIGTAEGKHEIYKLRSDRIGLNNFS